MKRAAPYLLLLSLAACDGLTGPQLPTGAVSFHPPARYQQWWDMVQTCSGLSGDFRSVRWFHVPDAHTLGSNANIGSYNAIWYRHKNRIVLAGAVVNNGHVVRHEMLHSLLNAEGHPAEQFQGKCGGVVTCSIACEQDGGGPLAIPPASPIIRSDGFGLELQLFPATHAGGDAGATSIVLTATNPHPHPAWVTPFPTSFRVRLERQDGPGVIQGIIPSAPGQRLGFDALGGRRYAFDFELPAGTYTVRGFFDLSETTVQYQVAP